MTDEKPKYLFSHNAFDSALWKYDSPPECFVDSDTAIIAAHNRSVHDVFAACQRDFNILYGEYQTLLKEFNQRGNKIMVQETKIKRLSDTVRRLGEEAKRDVK